MLTAMLALGATAAAVPARAETAAATAPRCTPNLAVRGMSLPSWWNGTYRSERYTESLADLRKLGFNAVALIPTLFLKSVDANDIYASEQTESIENVAHAAKLASDQGLRVMIKPHLTVKDYGQPPQAINPSDREAFFENYRAFVRRYAELAQETGAYSLAIGAELAQLTGPADRDQWLRVADDARRHYRGPLVYAANWGEDRTVSFWDAVDYIGIDMYAPMAINPAPNAGDAPISRDLIVERWTKAPAVPDGPGIYGRSAYVDLFRETAAEHGKQILFTEIGVRSVAGALSRPWDYEKSYSFADFGVQTAFYEALMQIACEQNDGWLAGMYLWGWRVDSPPSGKDWIADYSIENKPASGVIKSFFGGYPVSDRPPAILRPNRDQPVTPTGHARGCPERSLAVHTHSDANRSRLRSF